MSDDCAICGDPLFDDKGVPIEEKGETKKVSQLPCKHMFHKECLQPLLDEPPASCPVCRRQFAEHEMRKVDDKASALPVERLPEPPEAVKKGLKTIATMYNQIDDFKDRAKAQLSKKYELSDVLLSEIFNEAHRKGGAYKKHTTHRHRNIRRRRTLRRRRSNRRT